MIVAYSYYLANITNSKLRTAGQLSFQSDLEFCKYEFLMYLLIFTEWRSNKYKVKMGKWLRSDERVQQADDRDRVMRSGEIKFSLINYRSWALLSLFM